MRDNTSIRVSRSIKDLAFRNIENPGTGGSWIISNAKNSTINNVKIENIDVKGYLNVIYNADNCNIMNIDISNISIGSTPYGFIDNVKNSYISNIKTHGESDISLNSGGIIVTSAENTIIKDCINECDVKSAQNSGMIVGSAKNSLVYNCSNSGSVTATGDYVAGVVRLSDNSAIIKCHNTGNIKSESTYSLKAGLVFETKNNTLIQECYNTGEISGGYCGGIVCLLRNSTVNNCYNNGKIEGGSYAVVGISADSSQSNIIN